MKQYNSNSYDNVYGAVITACNFNSSPGSSDKCRTASSGCRPLNQADGLSHRSA